MRAQLPSGHFRWAPPEAARRKVVGEGLLQVHLPIPHWGLYSDHPSWCPSEDVFGVQCSYFPPGYHINCTHCAVDGCTDIISLVGKICVANAGGCHLTRLCADRAGGAGEVPSASGSQRPSASAAARQPPAQRDEPASGEAAPARAAGTAAIAAGHAGGVQDGMPSGEVHVDK